MKPKMSKQDIRYPMESRKPATLPGRP